MDNGALTATASGGAAHPQMGPRIARFELPLDLANACRNNDRRQQLVPAGVSEWLQGRRSVAKGKPWGQEIFSRLGVQAESYSWLHVTDLEGGPAALRTTESKAKWCAYTRYWLVDVIHHGHEIACDSRGVRRAPSRF
jgi:hypothetical protein